MTRRGRHVAVNSGNIAMVRGDSEICRFINKGSKG